MIFEYKNRRRLCFVAAIGALVVLGLLNVFPKERAEGLTPRTDSVGSMAAPLAPQSDGQDALAPQLAALSNDVKMLRLQVQAMASRVDLVGEEPVVLSQPQIDDIRAEREAYMAEMEDGFREEHVDAAWARQSTAAVRAQVDAHPALQNALKSVECRAEKCRVELEERDAEPLSADLPMLVMALSGSFPTAEFEQVEQEPGKRLQVVYFTR
jgi:hypothetical protein